MPSDNRLCGHGRHATDIYSEMTVWMVIEMCGAEIPDTLVQVTEREDKKRKETGPEDGDEDPERAWAPPVGGYGRG